MLAQGISPAEAGLERGGDGGLTLELPPLGEEKQQGGRKVPPRPPPAQNGARGSVRARLEPVEVTTVEGCGGDAIPAPPIAVPIVTHATKSPNDGEFACVTLPWLSLEINTFTKKKFPCHFLSSCYEES